MIELRRALLVAAVLLLDAGSCTCTGLAAARPGRGTERLTAGETTALAGTDGLSRSGTFRGHHVKLQVKQELGSHFSHRLTAEALFPGNHYTAPRDDIAQFYRYGITLSW